MKMSMKRKRFVKKYVENMGNGKQAALESYDVKEKYAGALAYNLLKKPEIQKAIEERLNDVGLDLDTMNTFLKEGIQANADMGKPSQAVFADLLKFAYKLHNVIPASKSMNMSYSKKEVVNRDYNEIKEELAQINENTSKILEDLK